jgi:hypothetical protein
METLTCMGKTRMVLPQVFNKRGRMAAFKNVWVVCLGNFSVKAFQRTKQTKEKVHLIQLLSLEETFPLLLRRLQKILAVRRAVPRAMGSG